MTFEQADYKYKSTMSDKGLPYSHPIKSESSEYPRFWVLRDEYGVVAFVDSKTGIILN